MKRLFFNGTIEQLKETGLETYSGAYSTPRGSKVTGLWINRQHNKKRLVVISDTSYHDDLNYDEILFNFLQGTKKTDLRTERERVGMMSTYAIVKSQEVLKLDEVLEKDMTIAQGFRDDYNNGNITLEEAIEKSEIENPYRNPYFIGEGLYNILFQLRDNLILEELDL